MSGTEFARAAPSSEGVDAAGVEAFLDAMSDARDVELHSLMVLRHGRVVAEGWWAPYRAERVHLLYSLSKSFTATAAALAIGEGLLELDRTVLSYFPEWDAEITDPRSRSMLVRHIAAMASGHHDDTVDAVMAADSAEPVRAFLRLPPESDAGTVFAYNQLCTYALGAIVQRESGQTLVEYLRPRLFEPLGIDEAGWQQHPPGRNLGFTGLYATTDAVAKLGQLYLQNGWWEGRQLLPAEWVEAATSRRIGTPRQDSPDWRQGYGFQFWMARHGYRGDGAYGQFCVVLPEHELVVAITGASIDMQAVLDGLWTHVLPALDDVRPAEARAGETERAAGAEAAGADERMARRLAAAALPPAEGRAEPRVARDWDGIRFTPAAVPREQPSPEAVEVTRTTEGWRIALIEASGPLEATLSVDAWSESRAGGAVPIAVSGGWRDGEDERLVVDVLFLETPHRLTVTCALGDRAFTAAWATAPLWPTALHDLRMP
ncbi:serine hydrolase domain-containing protein [Microbacterium sp.]|uniref:serine hydrolase domain-containing protein n=1 Tax=Microbacterium sp. TaxID=51671 RepID=UPI0039E2CDBD